MVYRYVPPSVTSYTEQDLRSSIEALGASPTATGDGSSSGSVGGTSDSGSDGSS